MPERFPVKQLYRFYFRRVLPKIGKWISKDDNAYAYLPMSVEKFHKPTEFMDLLASKGWRNGAIQRYTFGIVTQYTAQKG